MDRVLKAARASGSLNLSNRSLRELPDEVYKNLDATRQDEKWWEGVELQKLILAHNNLELLKDDIKNLTTLAVLNVSHNKLSFLPPAIGELPLLKSLDVSFNSISSIPEEIGSATCLVSDWLHLKFCAAHPLALWDSLSLCYHQYIWKNQLQSNKLFFRRYCWFNTPCHGMATSLNQMYTDPLQLADVLKKPFVHVYAYLLLSEQQKDVIQEISATMLDCSNNQLKGLPRSLGRCLDLAELKASNNCIVKLPDELVNCSKLIKVEVEGNKLTMISDDMLKSWTMLTELNAARNLLTSIPESIGLSQLIRLDFHQNKISSIPSTIKGCCSLAEFYVRINMLSSLPAEIGALSRLGTLDLSTNQLKEFPVEACKLRLSMLDLSNNSLSGLPPELGTMTTLRKLLLTGNPLRTLRSSLVFGPTPALLKYLRSRLSSEDEASGSGTTPTKEIQIAMATRLSLSSKELSLSSLGLTSVPSAVWETSGVVKVDLSRNLIEELPNELSSCSSLEALILSWNKIKEWPGRVLSSIPNLSCLKLDNNLLAKIPFTFLEGLTKLQILDLSGNTSLMPESSAFSNLPQLQELDLRRIQLHEVPSSLLCLQQLQVLDLSQNRLTSIPEDFRNLTSLVELDLSDNNIAALPSELGLLEPSLQVLKLDGNPIRSIRRSILEGGTKAILKYLKDKLPDE